MTSKSDEAPRITSTADLGRGNSIITRQGIEVSGFLVLFALLAYAWFGLTPRTSLLAYALNPAYFALVAATFTAISYLALRLMPARTEPLERLLLASLLAGMPLIYFWGALLAGDHRGMALEAVGFGVFATIAVSGYRRSVLLLGLGIVAHGIAWDSWHHNHTAYVESWYPVGCFMVDIGFGLLIITRYLAQRPTMTSS